MSPEVLNEDSSYDEKADVWSCCVIAFFLLGGVPPFLGKNE